MIVDFVEAGVLEQSLEALFHFEDMRLPFSEDPLTELQAYFFEIDVAEFCDETEHRLKLLEGAIGEVSCVEPKTLDAVFGVFDDVVTYLF